MESRVVQRASTLTRVEQCADVRERQVTRNAGDEQVELLGRRARGGEEAPHLRLPNAQRDAAQKGNEQSEAQLAKLGVTFTTPDLQPFQAAVKPFWTAWATKTGSTELIDSIQKM